MDDDDGGGIAFGLICVVLSFIGGACMFHDIKQPITKDLQLQKQVCVVVTNIGADQTLCPGECFDWRDLHICYTPKKLEKE